MTILEGCTQAETGETEKTFLPPLKNHQVEVDTEKVRFGDFNLEILSNGKALADEISEIQFSGTGRIHRIMVHNGDFVDKGQALCQIDDSELRLQRNKMSAQMDKALIELDDRLIDFGYRLKDSSRVPPPILKMAKIKSGYLDAIFNIADVRSAIAKAVVKAPFAGRIANLHAKVYNEVQASTNFCTLFNDRSMRVEFKILESELPIVKLGAKVLLSSYSLKTGITAEITEIAPLVDDNGMVEVAAMAENKNGLLISGMEVRLSILKTIPNLLYIRKDALLIRNNKKVVFTVDNGVARWNYVTTGFESKNFIVINSGLDKDDIVVVGNNLSLSDGVHVVYQ